jgi:hypothetical protein
MDCSEFDELSLAALYGELEDAAATALRRHVDVCPRCAGQWASLRGAREAVTALRVDAPAGLAARILAAEREAHHQAPWHRKVIRAAAWAGSLAMRPQLAMAALFVFIAGSSLLLLRGGARTSPAPVAISEQGEPDPSRAKGEEASAGEGSRGGVGRAADADAVRAAAAPAAEQAAAPAESDDCLGQSAEGQGRGSARTAASKATDGASDARRDGTMVPCPKASATTVTAAGATSARGASSAVAPQR